MTEHPSGRIQISKEREAYLQSEHQFKAIVDGVEHIASPYKQWFRVLLPKSPIHAIIMAGMTEDNSQSVVLVFEPQ